jgi:hypothetical protein
MKLVGSSVAIIIGSLLVGLPGCSRKAPRVTIPEWDPAGFTDVILEQLDKNGDAFVDQMELAEAPGLRFGARSIDTNGDGKLSREELEARFTKYQDAQAGLVSKELRITHNGRPLVGANVRLVPEFFLKDVIEPASGTTIVQGMVQPSIDDQSTPLMRPGYYRVEVSASHVKLPAKFHSATILGVEVSPFHDQASGPDRIEIQLDDKD